MIPCTLSDIKKLTCYEEYPELIIAKLGGRTLDEIRYYRSNIINDLVIQVQLMDGSNIYLPIIATESGKRARTQAEEFELQRIENQKRTALSKIEHNLHNVNQNKANSGQEVAFTLTNEDKKSWWNYLEQYYPGNYELAKRYYSSAEDPTLRTFGVNKQNYTINEYFAIYGLPKIYTDKNHNIQVESA